MQLLSQPGTGLLSLCLSASQGEWRSPLLPWELLGFWSEFSRLPSSSPYPSCLPSPSYTKASSDCAPRLPLLPELPLGFHSNRKCWWEAKMLNCNSCWGWEEEVKCGPLWRLQNEVRGALGWKEGRMRPGEGPSEERRAGRLWGKVHWQAEITLIRKVR